MALWSEEGNNRPDKEPNRTLPFSRVRNPRLPSPWRCGQRQLANSARRFDPRHISCRHAVPALAAPLQEPEECILGRRAEHPQKLFILQRAHTRSNLGPFIRYVSVIHLILLRQSWRDDPFHNDEEPTASAKNLLKLLPPPPLSWNQASMSCAQSGFMSESFPVES